MEQNQIDAEDCQPMILDDDENHKDSGSNSGSGSDLSESNSCSADDDEIDEDSESDSDIAESESSPVSDRFGVFTANGIMVRVEGLERETIIKSFVSGMGAACRETEVVAVYKNSTSGLTRRARFDGFRVFTEAVAHKCGGNPNIKYAWYGGSRDEISEILLHGFGSNNELVGGRIQLVPANFALDAAQSSGVDEDGVRHMLMCRVILGKTELVPSGSNQARSGCGEFDSGVDSLVNPRKYIVWSASMNSHICPAYVVSFKAPPCLKNYATTAQGSTSTTPQRTVSFPDLLPVLARFLSPSQMAILYQLRDDYWAKNISLAELNRKLKLEVDGKVLASAIKLTLLEHGSSAASSAFPAPGMVNLPDLMKVLPRFLPPSKMAMLATLSYNHWAKKISLAEVNRQVRVLVDKKGMSSAIKLMKPTQGIPALRRSTAPRPMPLLLASLARFLPPSQMKILARLLIDFRSQKITLSELKRKLKLIVDDKVMASAIKLVTPGTQGRSTASDISDLLKLPNSSRRDIYFPDLMPIFERSLPPLNMALLAKSLDDFKANKIARPQLIKRVRFIVGEELLVSAVKSYKREQQQQQQAKQLV